MALDLYPLIRSGLFLLPPERAHHLTFGLLGGAPWLGRLLASPVPQLPVQVAGLAFRNPLGLAAGLDKDARLLHVWDALGVGFVEVGTVTPLPQPGNPPPRLFRLPADQALINRLGFNNAGAWAMAARLYAWRNRYPASKLVVGVNLGKNKHTPNEGAALDYVMGLRQLYACADYLTLNVSSPNTPGLRDLQAQGPLREMLNRVQEVNQALPAPRPIFLKLSPDLADEDLLAAAQEARLAGLAGLIATNTTTARVGLASPQGYVSACGAGGLSGPPLHARAVQVVRLLATTGLPVMGVGGVHNAATAAAMRQAGACLLQFYTGWVYHGPALLAQVALGWQKAAAPLHVS